MRTDFAILTLLCCAASLRANTEPFARYQIILDRKAFGQAAPPPAAPVQQTIPLSQSFAKTLRLCSLLDDEDGIRVGLVDAQSKTDFFLRVGEIAEGIELVSASFEDEEAILRKGAEMAVIKLNSGEIEPMTAAQHASRVKNLESSYAERRKQRLEERRQRTERPVVPPPEITGEELKKHLQEYQMEVIRQGLPPLPIPLTPEMDNQLVAEGVLPPM